MATIQFRIDPLWKARLQKTLEAMGLDISGAMSMYIRKIILTKSIPFDVSVMEGPTPAQWKEIHKETQWALKHGKGFDSAEALLRDILGDKDYDAWMAESVSGVRVGKVPSRRQATPKIRLRSSKIARHDRSAR